MIMREFSLVCFNPEDTVHVQAHDALMKEAFGTSSKRNAELRSMTGFDGIYLLYLNLEPVATINAQRCEQYINNKPLTCWMVAGVAVKEEYRGQGIGTILWQKLFYEAHKQGIILINLYPANLPFYRSLGFGLSATRTKYKAQLDRIFRGQSKNSLPATPLFKSWQWKYEDGFQTEWAPLKSLYEKFASDASGMIKRNAYLWAKKLATDKNVERTALLFGTLLAPSGYLVYQETTTDTLLVTDWAALNHLALAGIRHFLYSLKERWRYASWFGAPADPLVLSLPDHGYPDICYSIEEQAYLMSRIVNIKAALENCGYPDANGSLIIRYEDQFMPEQTGYYQLRLRHGRPSVRRLKKPALADLSVNARGMALLISHVMPSTDIKRLGLLEVNDKALRTSEMFFHGHAPWCADQY